MFQFLLHLVFLLIQFFDSHFSGSNFSLQFFDLVIKHEFELFEFLCFLFKIFDSLFFFSDSAISFSKLSFLGLDALLKIIGDIDLVLQVFFSSFDFSLLLLDFRFSLLVVVSDDC